MLFLVEYGIPWNTVLQRNILEEYGIPWNTASQESRNFDWEDERHARNVTLAYFEE
jgi:hypothetical protein